MLPADKIIAHRGASAYAPENTMAAFEKAYSLGNRFVEFDVMCSANGDPFVFHDDKLNRTTNGKGLFGEADTSLLQNLDAGSWFSQEFKNEHIPPFKEVLHWLEQKNVQANIEIKPHPKAIKQTTEVTLDFIHNYWQTDKAPPLVSSFSWEVLILCRTLVKDIPLGLLLNRWDEQWLAKARQLSCYSIHVNQRSLTRDWVTQMKGYGYKVCAYTVNSKRLALKLFGWGVDAIFSDYPDLLV